jgi:hypothetical protein
MVQYIEHIFQHIISPPLFEPVINWKFKFAEISLSISKGLDYLVIDVDDLSCNLPSIARTNLLIIFGSKLVMLSDSLKRLTT